MQQDHHDEAIANSSISAEQVSSYLRSFPHFFEQHASLLAEIYLPSPHGSGAISLAERQQLAQRDKIHALENRLITLISYAEENDATSKKIHDFSVNLLKSRNFEAVQATIIQCMQEDFLVSESAIRIWANPNDDETPRDYTPENKDFIEWVNDLTRPYCGEMPDITKDLLSDQLQSFVFIPLYKNTAEKQTFGVLILGSVDAQHFKSDMGVMYLERIGDLVSAALSAHI
jgi:uncharacterized protein